MTNYFILSSTILFCFLALIWKKEDALNTFIKMAFILLTCWGGYLLLGPLNLVAQL